MDRGVETTNQFGKRRGQGGASEQGGQREQGGGRQRRKGWRRWARAWATMGRRKLWARVAEMLERLSRGH
eukprot:1821853-Alexandrium_andersonii.AAC.1